MQIRAEVQSLMDSVNTDKENVLKHHKSEMDRVSRVLKQNEALLDGCKEDFFKLQRAYDQQSAELVRVTETHKEKLIRTTAERDLFESLYNKETERNVGLSIQAAEADKIILQTINDEKRTDELQANHASARAAVTPPPPCHEVTAGDQVENASGGTSSSVKSVLESDEPAAKRKKGGETRRDSLTTAQFVTRAEAAKMLDVSFSTLRRMVHRGDIDVQGFKDKHQLYNAAKYKKAHQHKDKRAEAALGRSGVKVAKPKRGRPTQKLDVAVNKPNNLTNIPCMKCGNWRGAANRWVLCEHDGPNECNAALHWNCHDPPLTEEPDTWFCPKHSNQ